jgi:hypothetical protein
MQISDSTSSVTEVLRMVHGCRLGQNHGQSLR